MVHDNCKGMNRLLTPLLSCLTLGLLSGAPLIAAEVDFSRQVLPILSNKCFVCHGPDTRDADMLRLDSFAAATSDRGGYKAIDPVQPANSRVLQRIQSADDPMPPADAEKQLTAEERLVLSEWIREGGKYSRHWAFVPPQAVPVPGSAFSNPVDAFLSSKMSSVSAEFAPAADRRVLARRVALVLTGLPPEPEQLDRFLAGEGEAAYQALIDELLASPRFGEHQARYWLDAVRYGDTHGLHLDNRRGIYPYRDWVVRAFNADLPLDEFIRMQVAGDLRTAPTAEDLVATGYVRLNPSTGEGGAIADEFQMKNNFDRVETLGTVFLGLSLTCARCHSHKFDPVTQTEYYQLLAFFNSTAEPALDGNKYEYGPTVRVPADQAGWDQFDQLRQQARQLAGDAEHEAGAALPRAAVTQIGVSPRAVLEVLAAKDGPWEKLSTRGAAEQLLRDWLAFEKTLTTSLVARDLPQPRPTRLLHRGEYNQPVGDPLQPDVLRVLNPLPANAPRNRLALAAWLTSRENPLVARVLVNRLWQRVFGAGLVRSPEDFGRQGQQPTHPDLLDWLALELQRRGWSLKSTMRLLVSSRAFRQSSAWREEIADPENRLFARGPSWRLDAEVLRDIALWSSGMLDPHMGGEGIKPYQPDGMWQALAHPASNTRKYERDHGPRLYRRSLYVYWKRTSPHPMMTLFDAPDRESSCVRRSHTNTPVQSLALLNETQRVELARKLAERLLSERGDDEARIDLLFDLLACRGPEPAETAACRDLLAAMRRRFARTPADALQLLQVGDAPRNQQVDPAEVAAWTQLTSVVLAADPVILLY